MGRGAWWVREWGKAQDLDPGLSGLDLVQQSVLASSCLVWSLPLCTAVEACVRACDRWGATTLQAPWDTLDAACDLYVTKVCTSAGAACASIRHECVLANRTLGPWLGPPPCLLHLAVIKGLSGIMPVRRCPSTGERALYLAGAP